MMIRTSGFTVLESVIMSMLRPSPKKPAAYYIFQQLRQNINERRIIDIRQEASNCYHNLLIDCKYSK